MAVDPFSIGAIVAPIAGGVLGNIFGAGDRADARNLSNQALAEILGVTVPDVEKMKLNLTPYQIQGMLDSIYERAEQMGPSAMETVATDPRLAQAQMQALTKLQEVGALGLTPAEQVQAREMQRAVQAQEAQRQASIIQNMRSRGTAGSGAEAAARLLSSQGMANQLAASSDDLRAQAFNRALQATAQAGQLGGNIRQQEFGEKERIASARDAIAQFNAQQRAGVQSRNIAAERARQAANLELRQRIADANVGLSNQQQQYNKQLLQQDFQNRMNRAAAAAGAYGGAAQQRMGDAMATGNMWAGIGAGVGSGLGSYAGYLQNQQNQQFMLDLFGNKMSPASGGSSEPNMPLTRQNVPFAW